MVFSPVVIFVSGVCAEAVLTKADNGVAVAAVPPNIVRRVNM